MQDHLHYVHNHQKHLPVWIIFTVWLWLRIFAMKLGTEADLRVSENWTGSHWWRKTVTILGKVVRNKSGPGKTEKQSRISRIAISCSLQAQPSTKYIIGEKFLLLKWLQYWLLTFVFFRGKNIYINIFWLVMRNKYIHCNQHFSLYPCETCWLRGTHAVS